MRGEGLSAEQIGELSRLPSTEILHGQLVAMIASPIMGLVRTLYALIAGPAIQLQKIADEGLLPAGEAAAILPPRPSRRHRPTRPHEEAGSPPRAPRRSPRAKSCSGGRRARR